MAEQRNDIDLAVVQQHNARNDCWIVLHGKVYDVTAFLPEHPGGEEVVANLAGQDATDAFEEVGHSMQARNDALLYEIGTLKGAEKALGAFGDKAYNKHTFIASPLQTKSALSSWLPVLIPCLFALLACWITQCFFSR